jgi:polysaccharide biosynthesis/export protein
LNSDFVLTGAAKQDSAVAGLSSEPERAPPKSARERGAGLTEVARAADKLTAAATPGNTYYKIGPLDVIEFSVFKVPELSRVAQVADTGTVNLPLVGEIQAAGKTAQEVERDLTKKLGAKYLQSPQVTILIKEYNSQRVTIEGAVKTPGVQPIRGKTSLLQVLATAGGIDSTVSDTTVVVFRQIDGKRHAAKFDVAAIRSGEVHDPLVQSGDVIVAPTSATKETFNMVLKALPLATAFAPIVPLL